jgi:CRP/FNR family transcriptional regulator, cyclic AMP receptor protein
MDSMHQLRTVPLLRGFDDGSLQRIATHSTEQRLAAGEALFQEGDAGGVLYLVVEGEIEAYVGGGSRRQTLRRLGPGSHLGELAILDGAPRSTSARATRATRLLLVPGEVVMEEVLSSHDASREMLAEMARRLRGATSLVGEYVARNGVKEFEGRLTFSERLAERVAAFNGSWLSFGGVLIVTAVWVAANAQSAIAFDPYPYQLFNLLLGVAIALQGPMLMMSQNRQAQRDRAQAAAEYELNLKNEVGIENLAAGLARIEECLERIAPGDGRSIPAPIRPGD